MPAGKALWAVVADAGERRAGLRLGVLAAVVGGLSLGGLAARLAPAWEAQALVGALGAALEAAARLPAGAFLLGAALLWGGSVAAVWLSGLSILAVPLGLAVAVAQAVAAGFAAALVAGEAGPAGALVALVGVALPSALSLSVLGWAAVEAVDFALAAFGSATASARAHRFEAYALRGCLALAGALAMGALVTVALRPVLTLTVRLAGL